MIRSLTLRILALIILLIGATQAQESVSFTKLHEPAANPDDPVVDTYGSDLPEIVGIEGDTGSFTDEGASDAQLGSACDEAKMKKWTAGLGLGLDGTVVNLFEIIAQMHLPVGSRWSPGGLFALPRLLDVEIANFVMGRLEGHCGLPKGIRFGLWGKGGIKNYPFSWADTSYIIETKVAIGGIFTDYPITFQRSALRFGLNTGGGAFWLSANNEHFRTEKIAFVEIRVGYGIQVTSWLGVGPEFGLSYLFTLEKPDALSPEDAFSTISPRFGVTLAFSKYE